ncbi:universal stress protein [Natrinema salsiterrestre]|uniref:Universal stress protein n=1 Tax=Natrinema salsiterrestre TaxID=2950540 RepID=A0A9Q4L224_9EURY|nr:universal stress protein [Natrinema salsiterrestre]MDF9746212.1 universal stress protein [Natrinema salsiterrestre]
MYKIVIPIDEDETRAITAAEFVTDLGDESGLAADLDEVSVSIINVFKEFKAVDDGGNVRSEDLYDEDSYPDSVATARDHLAAAGVDVGVERRHGDPGEEIVDFAESVDADTIIIPGRKRSPVGKAVFGSVTQDVILNADSPVTIV